MLWDTLHTLFDSKCGHVGIFRFAFDFRSVVLVFADKHFSLGGELMPVAPLTLTGCTLEHLYIIYLITHYDYTLIIHNEGRLSVRGAHSVMPLSWVPRVLHSLSRNPRVVLARTRNNWFRSTVIPVCVGMDRQLVPMDAEDTAVTPAVEEPGTSGGGQEWNGHGQPGGANGVMLHAQTLALRQGDTINVANIS